MFRGTIDYLLCGEIRVVHRGISRNSAEGFKKWQRHRLRGDGCEANRHGNQTTSQERPNTFSALHRSTPQTRKGRDSNKHANLSLSPIKYLVADAIRAID